MMQCSHTNTRARARREFRAQAAFTTALVDERVGEDSDWVLCKVDGVKVSQRPSMEIVVCLVSLSQKKKNKIDEKSLTGRRWQQRQTVAGLSGAEYYYSSSHIVSPSHEHTLPSIRQEILMTHKNTSHMSLHK